MEDLLTKVEYKRILSSTNDPIRICYLIYNVEARTKIADYKVFTTMFFQWCIKVGQGNGLMRSLQIKKNFDKKFGL